MSWALIISLAYTIMLQLIDRRPVLKRANFSVLRNTKMVALLIEYAFITNTEDEGILINKVNNLAQWTCDGIINVVGGKVKESEQSDDTVQ